MKAYQDMFENMEKHPFVAYHLKVYYISINKAFFNTRRLDSTILITDYSSYQFLN